MSRISRVLPQGQKRILASVLLFLALSLAVPWIIHSRLGGEWPVLTLQVWWPGWMAVCVLMLLLYYLADGLRLYFTLRVLKQRVPLTSLLPLVFLNLLVSNLTPMATGGGIAQVWYLRRHGVHMGTATAATTLRTLQSVLLIFLPVPLLIIWLNPLAGTGFGETLEVTLALVAGVYLLFFYILFRHVRWVIATLELLLRLPAHFNWISTTRLGYWRFKIRREMIRFVTAMNLFLRGDPIYIMLSLAFTAVFLLTLFSFPALILVGLGQGIDYFETLGLTSMTTFVMYFAPTPGAAGVAEGALGTLFSDRVSASNLVLMILLWRFLTIHQGMLIGVPVTLHILLRGHANAKRQ
ncbi:lysylphosphatidylglycerol synthase transmembrane domain-containing protein [Nitrincola sp. A-D6]|uniref:lysylphosphatidylglycerol synthase transmembrane domain-containing protein n=1 Tax=Nitrincola sp. A-D6 TaxID=1545442 RepID=UPI00068D8AB6|nr:lysylphosphatidylglycerol synthase transmembrane domain-containing protein [Nitrincola sp. A-D6]